MAQEAAAQVVLLFDGSDRRCVTLFDALETVIRERAGDLPLPTVLGVLRLLEHSLIARGG